jgi:hypothetical protein
MGAFVYSIIRREVIGPNSVLVVRDEWLAKGLGYPSAAVTRERLDNPRLHLHT